jgi:hypothetical protein
MGNTPNFLTCGQAAKLNFMAHIWFVRRQIPSYWGGLFIWAMIFANSVSMRRSPGLAELDEILGALDLRSAHVNGRGLVL